MHSTQTTRAKEDFINTVLNITRVYRCEVYEEGGFIGKDVLGHFLNFQTIYPKLVVACTPSEASALMERLKHEKEKLDAAIKAAAEKSESNKSPKLPCFKMRMVQADELKMSISGAYMSRQCKGSDVIYYVLGHIRSAIESEIEKLDKQYRCEVLTTEEYVCRRRKLGDVPYTYKEITNEQCELTGTAMIVASIRSGKVRHDGVYRIRTDTGKSYRVTMFDREAQKRVQVSLGNVLICVTNHPENFRILDQSDVPRKTRSDSNVGFLGAYAEHAIYEKK